VLAAVCALSGLLASAGTANAAETHTITIDNGRLTMGYVFLNNQIMPADVPGPLNPNLPNASPTGTIEVSVSGSTATVAEEDFNMPVVWIPDPTAGGAPIPMTFKPVGGLAGTWNDGTGELTLTGTLRVDVIWGYNVGGARMCRFNAPGITWTTKPNAIYPGVAFNSPQGLDGNGALSAFWTELPAGESINGGDCGKPNFVVRDPGALWLSAGIEQVPPPPTCQDEGKDGLWPDCVDLEPAPKVEISRVQVGRAAVKAGKQVRLPVKVTNKGGKAATGLIVSLKSSNRGVRVPRQVRLNVPAGKTATVMVTVKAVRSARGAATITARAAGRTGRGRVTVR
jgi:hypothetical protein